MVQIVLAEPNGLLLDDLSAFLYDTALLNDVTVLSGPDYDYEFNQYFWRRNGRPTRRVDRVAVARVRHESPILIELLAGATGLVGLYKGLEYVLYTKSRWRKANTEQAIREEDLELKRLEVEKARRELEAGDKHDGSTQIVIEDGEPPIRVPRQAGVLQDSESQEYYARTVRRIERSPLEISDLSTREPEHDDLP